MDVFLVMDQRWEKCSTVLGRWAIIDGVKFVTTPRGFEGTESQKGGLGLVGPAVVEIEVGEGCFVQVVVSNGMTVVPVKYDSRNRRWNGVGVVDEVDETTRRRSACVCLRLSDAEAALTTSHSSHEHGTPSLCS